MIAELQSAIINKPDRRKVDKELTRADRVKIKVERRALLLRGAPVAICISAINAAVTLAVAWSRVDQLVISIWAALAISLSVVRLLLWRRFSTRKQSAHSLIRFTQFHILGMGINGVLWGALAPIFAVSGMLGNAFLPFLIAGMTAAAIASAGASWRAVLAFNIPALAPLGVAYFFLAGADGPIIAGIVFLYAIATAYLAWTTQQMIVRSIRLRSRNDHLLKVLTKQIDASHEAEQRFRSLVESSTDVTIIFSPEGLITYASPSVEKALGAPPQNLIGLTTKELVHPDDMEFFRAVGEKTLSKLGEVVPLDHVCLKAPGAEYQPLNGRLTNMLYVPGVEGFVLNGGVADDEDGSHLHAAE